MAYGIYFDRVAPAEALREALRAVFGVRLDLIYVGSYDQLNEHPGPDPVALITPADGQFGHEFSAGDALRELCDVTELELARAICRIARTRALLDDGTQAPDYWLLVAADGSFGRVQTDPDSDELTILYALEPNAGEPDPPVVDPPDWARTGDGPRDGRWRRMSERCCAAIVAGVDRPRGLATCAPRPPSRPIRIVVAADAVRYVGIESFEWRGYGRCPPLQS